MAYSNMLNGIIQQYGSRTAGTGIGQQTQNALSRFGSQQRGQSRGPAVGSTYSNPRAVNTDQVATLAETPIGSVTAEDLAETGLNMGPIPVGTLAMGAKNALASTLGRYGVVGGSPAPAVGSDDFYAQTPNLDHPRGYAADAGAQAQMANDIEQGNLSPGAYTGFGQFNQPTNPGFASAPSFSEAFGLDSLGNALGFNDIADAFESQNQDVFGGVAGNVGGNNMGGGRGTNAGIGGGRGAGGGIGGGVGDVGAGNPGGTGVL